VLAAEISNEYLSIMVGSNGRVVSGVASTAGSPKSAITEGWDANNPEFWTGYTTVRVDETDFAYGDSGTAVKAPTNGPDLSNESIWQVGDIQVKQTLQIVGSSTGQTDTGMYKYTVTNTGTTSHQVGIRTMMDTAEILGPAGTTMRVYQSEAWVDVRGADFLGQSVPQYWQVSLANGNTAYGTLVGGGASTPDRVAFYGVHRMLFGGGSWGFWNWNVGYGPAFVPMAGIFWNPATLGPGQSRDYVTFYGLGKVSTPTDATPPTTTAMLSSQPNTFGWHNTNVGVTLSSDDLNGSGVKEIHYVLGSSPELVVPTSPVVVSVASEGAVVLKYWAVDKAGNTEASKQTTINLDKTGPTIGVERNAGTYTVDQTLNIGLVVTDATSGVASQSHTSIAGPAYTYQTGTNTITVTAIDKAGNVSSKPVTFLISPDTSGISKLVEKMCTNSGVAGSLRQQLASIQEALAKGNSNALAGKVKAFVNHVQAQTGKSISAENARLLIDLVQKVR